MVKKILVALILQRIQKQGRRLSIDRAPHDCKTKLLTNGSAAIINGISISSIIRS
jgi:hypothetical protein